jgi:DNA-binding MarR family transcriptional regulator
MNGKRFLEAHIQVKRVVSLVATRVMAPLGLGRVQLSLVRELGRLGRCTQTALSDATATDPSATARALTLLASKRWIVRRRGEIDRREIYVELSPSGRKLLREVERVYSKIAVILGSCLDAQDVADVERIAGKLARLGKVGEVGEPRQQKVARGKQRLAPR